MRDVVMSFCDLQQPGDHEALAVLQVDRGLGAAHDEARNGDVADIVGGRRIDRRDFRRDVEADQPVLEHGRREVQADAVFLVGDGDLAVVLRNRDREFAAGEEACRLAGAGDQVRLGQPPGQATLLQRLDGDVDRNAVRQQAADDFASTRRRHRAGSSVTLRPPMP